MLAAIRTVMSADHTMLDPELDVSGCLLASKELGIKSVSWDMAKKELTKDREFQNLADWITGGCMRLPKILPIHLKQFWSVRGDLRGMDGVPMMGERTVVLRGLIRQGL